MGKVAEANLYERECMNEELYTKDDKRVLIVGGGSYSGKSYIIEMMKRAMLEQGYTGIPVEPFSSNQAFYLGEMEQPSTNFLTYSDNTPRIEPSNLLMKLIGRIYE
jgi:hypothetical protein